MNIQLIDDGRVSLISGDNIMLGNSRKALAFLRLR
jgi:hypothetical protein